MRLNSTTRPGKGWRSELSLFLAAMPSLHVGFAAAVGLTLALALRRRWSKTLAALWPPLVALSVIATANHYLLDIAVGLAVTALGYAIGRAPTTRPRPLRARSNVAVLPEASRP